MPRKLPPSAYVELRPATTARRSVVNPFGTAQAEDWIVPQGGSESALLAAQLQHQTAQRFRAAIAVSDAGTVAELCRQHDGLSYERVRGVLAGDVWMRLEDAVELAQVLGLELALTVSEAI